MMKQRHCWAYMLWVAMVAPLTGAEPTKKTPAGKKEAAVKKEEGPKDPFPEKKLKAVPLEGGVDWLNTAGPVELSKLKGKIILLDFWTYCCINCIHILPDLAKLEEEFPNELVVIGVHSAKFEGEKETQNIREAILRYGIKHPVVNDAKMSIWRSYNVHSWPTRVLIDPEGYYLGYLSGEGKLELFRDLIKKMAVYHEAKGTLDKTPVHFMLEESRSAPTPLRFPGKVAVDPSRDRVVIADSSQHRIVVANRTTGKLEHVIGAGQAGHQDGKFTTAQFNDPQGLALKDDLIFVADRKNHRIRRIDLKEKLVSTLAGTGKRGGYEWESMPGPDAELASPWDLLLLGTDLWVANAGTHQLWRMDLRTGKVGAAAGSGREFLTDGPARTSAFAQPSGLAADDKFIYVADSEISAIRKVSRKDQAVDTIVGEGLFEFGDVDGVGNEVRLQHALGVAHHDGKLYVADTYNNKIKQIDVKTGQTTTWLGDRKPGTTDEPPRFDEPGGIAMAEGKIYLADTNNHAIRVIDIATRKVTTLTIDGLSPVPPVEMSELPELSTKEMPEQSVSSLTSFTLRGEAPVAKSYKLNDLAPMAYRLELLGDQKPTLLTKGRLKENATDFTVKLDDLQLTAGSKVRFSMTYYTCQEGSEGVCRVTTQAWSFVIKHDPQAKPEVVLVKP